MINLPSLRHLRHLMALHDHGHFGRAAEACGVTQSTLSASIKELEGVLETTLVDRSKRRVVLTPVGIEAVDRARRIVKEAEDLVSPPRCANHSPGRCAWGPFRPLARFCCRECCQACARRVADSGGTSWKI